MLDEKGFDLWADQYDEAVGLSDEANTYPFAGYKAVLGRIYELVMQKQRPSVLDAGFGTAVLTAKLYEQGCAVFGQDFSVKMIALAREKMPKAQLYQGDFADGLAAPLAAQSYDVIVSTYALHHLTNEQKVTFLRELRAHLNEGGCILIGDIAFATHAEMAQCRRDAGDDWDDEEQYIVAEELRKDFADLTFEKISFCAGVMTLHAEG